MHFSAYDFWNVILPAACMTVIEVYSPLFDRLRRSGSLFRCPMCLGFWVGVIVGLLRQPIYAPDMLFPYLWAVFKAGVTTSILAYVLYQVVVWLENVSD